MYSQEVRYGSGIGIAELKVKPSLGTGLFDEECIVGVELRAHVELQRRSCFFLAGRSYPSSSHYVVKLMEDMENRQRYVSKWSSVGEISIQPCDKVSDMILSIWKGVRQTISPSRIH
jgi:hypothetical protein